MLKLTTALVLIAAICLPALLHATVHAADISVDSSCSLADAITATNSDTATGNCPAGNGADTIALTEDVTLTAALPEIESEITIEGNGYTISGNEQHQIFWVEETGALAIQYATLADGRGTDDDDLFDEDVLIGGAIVNWGSLEVSDSVFMGNSADWGGAIINLGEANASTNDSTFTNNSASYGGVIYNGDLATLAISSGQFTQNSAGSSGDGGAIYNLSTASIAESSFTNNSAGLYGSGGAIFNSGGMSLSIDDSVFADNSASTGGAIRNTGKANLTIGNSVFSDNSVDGWGGAIYNGNEAIIDIKDSAFTDNVAKGFGGFGGAIYTLGATATIRNSKFADNVAVADGGAIFQDYVGSIAIDNCNFMNNSASSGGAISIDVAGAITNTLFAENTARNGGAVYMDAPVTIAISSFTDNVAKEDGGAIFNSSVTESSISDSTFTGNTAGEDGGAIRNTEQGIFSVQRSAFRMNMAVDGGAIYSWGKATILRSTFAGNQALEDGGAVAIYGVVTLISTVLSDNTGGDCHLGRYGEVLESSKSHISDGTCGASWSGPITDNYCPPGEEGEEECQIGAPKSIDASD